MTLTSLLDFPLVEPGDDLVAMILDSLSHSDVSLSDGDVLVLAQKIVSKAENRYAYLNEIMPGENAQKLAKQIDKDPKLVELILSESKDVIRQRPGVVIVEHLKGYVHANAGIDRSNIASDSDNPRVLLLPEDSDQSAAKIRDSLFENAGIRVNIIINDSAGRAWRNGTVGMALGTAGFQPVEDLVGAPDLFGRPMETTEVAVADELAAAASFLMGQSAEASPVVHIKGASLRDSDLGSASLIRDKSMDLFR